MLILKEPYFRNWMHHFPGLLNYSSADCIYVRCLLRGGCQLDHCKQLIKVKVYCLFDGLWMSHPLCICEASIFILDFHHISFVLCVSHLGVSIPTQAYRPNHGAAFEVVCSVLYTSHPHALMLLTFRKVSCTISGTLDQRLWFFF